MDTNTAIIIVSCLAVLCGFLSLGAGCFALGSYRHLLHYEHERITNRFEQIYARLDAFHKAAEETFEELRTEAAETGAVRDQTSEVLKTLNEKHNATFKAISEQMTALQGKISEVSKAALPNMFGARRS